jgi:hypothetical protein
MSDDRCKMVELCDRPLLMREIERLREQLVHVAGFLHGMAFRVEQHMLDKTQAAADCRAMAVKLEGK